MCVFGSINVNEAANRDIGLLESAWSIDGHRVQHLVEQLQRSVQVHLDPARCVLDRVARIVGTPALDEAQTQNAQAPQIVDANAGGRGQTCVK